MNNEDKQKDAPTTAAEGVPSVADDPEFMSLLGDFEDTAVKAHAKNGDNGTGRAHFAAIEALIDHLNADKAGWGEKQRQEGFDSGWAAHQRVPAKPLAVELKARAEAADAKVRELEAERGEVVAWMLEFEDERVVTADPKEVEMWRTQHDNPYEVTSLHAFRAAQEATKPSEGSGDDERAKFEAEFKRHSFPLASQDVEHNLRRGMNREYADAWTQSNWEFWKAGRAALAQPAEPVGGDLLEAVRSAWKNYERMGAVCEFEIQPMIYASVLEELNELAERITK